MTITFWVYETILNVIHIHFYTTENPIEPYRVDALTNLQVHSMFKVRLKNLMILHELVIDFWKHRCLIKIFELILVKVGHH